MIRTLVGKADNLDLVFNQVDGQRWEVVIPPDLSDGCYVVELRATNYAQETAQYYGVLYMVQGQMVCLHLQQDPISAELLPERYELELLPRGCRAGGDCGC